MSHKNKKKRFNIFEIFRCVAPDKCQLTDCKKTLDPRSGMQNGATTLSIKALSIMVHSIMALSIKWHAPKHHPT